MNVEWVEVTAKTVSAAKDRALDLLGVDESQAEFEVVEEPRTGLFGRVKGEARVRARIQPKAPRPKAERRERRRPRSRDGGDAGPAPAERAGGRSGRSSERPERSAARSGGQGGRRPAAGGIDPDRQVDAEGGGDMDTERQPAGRRPRPAGNERGPDRPGRVDEGEKDSVSDDDEATDDGRQTEHAVAFLEGLVDSFGLTATVSSAEVDEHYDEVRIDGADLGMLIGPKAATLEAVQELSRVVASRRSGGRGESRFRVDVGGYRQRRREALERFTVKLAEEVRTGGTAKALEPMNAADRKVVHDTVGGLDGVSTISEGEEPRRRVVIVPGS